MYEYYNSSYHHFYTFVENKSYTVTGIVTDIVPRSESGSTHAIVKIRTKTMKTNDTTINIHKNIVFYVPQDPADLCVSDEIALFNVRCKKPDNENFANYQIKENIAATVFCKNFNYTHITRPMVSLSRWVHFKKNSVLAILKQKMSPSCFSFFASFLLGNRATAKNYAQSYDNEFKQWGVYHLLARSGIHLTLFIFVWHTVGGYIPLAFRIKHFFFLLLGILYYIFSWPSLPFVRAFMLFFFNKSCQLLRLPYHPLHYLSLACLICVTYQPHIIFFLDFQLTFLLTYALTWLNRLEQERFIQLQQSH